MSEKSRECGKVGGRDLYQGSLSLTAMGPVPHADRHYFPRLVDELVPGVAGGVDDGVVAVEDTVRQIGLA